MTLRGEPSYPPFTEENTEGAPAPAQRAPIAPSWLRPQDTFSSLKEGHPANSWQARCFGEGKRGVKSNRTLDAWGGRRGFEPQAGQQPLCVPGGGGPGVWESGALLAAGRLRARLALVRMQPLDPGCSLMAASD